MSLQPEAFDLIRSEISAFFLNKRCTGFESGQRWIALFFRPGNKNLFISWQSHFQGFCFASHNDITTLKRTESRSFPIKEALQKYVTNTQLSGVARVPNDRIICMEFSRSIGPGISRRTTVVIELTGTLGNLFLLREDGTIIESTNKQRSEIVPGFHLRTGSSYSPPPPFRGFQLPVHPKPSLYFNLNNIVGYGKQTGTAIDESFHLFTISKWLDYLRSNKIGTGSQNVSISEFSNGSLSVFPVPLGKYTIHHGNILNVLQGFTIDPILFERMNQVKREYFKIIKKKHATLLSKKKGYLNSVEKSGKAEFYRISGELLLANRSKIPKGSSVVTLCVWKDDHYEDMEIKLDPSKTISHNAQLYFKKFKRFNVNVADISKKIEQISSEESELSFLAEKTLKAEDLGSLDLIAPEILSLSDTVSRRRSHGPVRILNFRDHQIYVGTSSKGNRKVSFVFAQGDDLWFHVRGIPGGHVILKNPPGKYPEKIILETAASLAAYHSKAKEAAQVPVDYTLRKYVRPIPGTLAEVTYSHSKTIRVSPDLWKINFQENESTQDEGKI